MNLAWPGWLKFHLMVHNHVWPQVVRLIQKMHWNKKTNKQSAEFFLFFFGPCTFHHKTQRKKKMRERESQTKKKNTVECYCRPTIKLHWFWFMFSHPMCAVLRCTHTSTHVCSICAVLRVKVICILNLIIRLLLLVQFKLYYVGIRDAWSWPPTHCINYVVVVCCSKWILAVIQ